MRKAKRKWYGLIRLFLCTLLAILLPRAIDAAVVQIPDGNLANALKSALAVSSVTTEKMGTVTQLNLANKGIQNLTGMESASKLVNLSLEGNRVSNLSPLASLTNLETLDLSGNPVKSLSALSELTALRVLHITDCPVESLEEILELPKLQFVFCGSASMNLSSGSLLSKQIAALRARGTYVVIAGEGDSLASSGAASSKPTTSSQPSTSSGTTSSKPTSSTVSSQPPVSSVPEPEAKFSLKNGATVSINRNGNTVWKIPAGTTVAQLLSQLDGNGYTTRVVNSSGTQVTGTLMTGMNVQLLKNGQVADQLTVIVRGDCNGDGKETLTDMVQVKAHLLKRSELTGAFWLAADRNYDGNVTLTDFVQIKAKLLGKLVD